MWHKIWLQIKRVKANCSSFEQTWPHPFICDGCLLIIVSFAHPNLFNKRFALPSAFYPLLRLLPSSSPSQVWPVTLGGGSVRRRPRGHVPVRLSQCCLPPPPREWGSVVTKRSHPTVPPRAYSWRSIEEAGSLWARGRKPYTRARAKLADSSDACHGVAGFFSSTRRKKRSTHIEVSADSSSDDPGKEWCW
jgi:hypothetical protein